MKSTNCIRLALLLAVISLAGCDPENSFLGPDAASGGGLSGGTGGGTGGSGGGTGGGGGIEPIMQFDTGYLFDDFVAGRISGDGTTMVWVDTEDPVGNNPGGNTQLFAKDLGTGDITQITLDPARFSYRVREWDVTDNGDFVVFVSDNDITGDNPNREGNVFVASTSGAGITQVTRINAATNSVRDPQIANSGLIVFASAEDLTGDNPVVNSAQIFTINFDGTGLRQVTSGDLDVRDLALADDGNRIAFTSNGDPFGTNADGSDEIFVIDINGLNLVQLTASDTFSEKPRISDDGSRVAFVSSADHAAGQNAEQNAEVFVAMADGSAIAQVSSNTTRASGYYSGVGTSATTPSFALTGPGSMDISGDGTTVVYGSSADHTGDNPNGDHTIFAVPSDGTGVPVQILRTGTVSIDALTFRADRPSVVTNGTGVLFISQYNLTSSDQAAGDSFRIYTSDIR
jgi:Tol biopolymer transport system component